MGTIPQPHIFKILFNQNLDTKIGQVKVRAWITHWCFSAADSLSSAITNCATLEAEMLRIVCNDVELGPVLQEVTGETLNHGANKAPDARLDIHARGFWERQRSAFFDVRVCHPNADSYRDLTPKQIYKKHENEKKRQYAERVMEIEQGTFTPIVFTTIGGMADECVRYHSRLAKLIANKNRESYSSAISWIRAKVSFSHRTLCDTMLEGLKIQKTTARLC